MISHECQTTYSTIGPIKIFHRLSRHMRILWRRYGEWNKMKWHHQELLRMDGRMLKDIGLSRTDVIKMAKGYNFWRYMFQPEAYNIDKGKKSDSNTRERPWCRDTLCN